MNQMDRSPVTRFCQTRSGFLSPLKSPTAAIDQAIGTLGRSTALEYVLPFINQIERSPVAVFSQTMSALPSASKSAEPAILHAVCTVGRMTALLYAVPLSNQAERSPLFAFCQRRRVVGIATAAVSAPDAATGGVSATDPLNVERSGLLVLMAPGSAPRRLNGPALGTPGCRAVSASGRVRASDPTQLISAAASATYMGLECGRLPIGPVLRRR